MQTPGASSITLHALIPPDAIKLGLTGRDRDAVLVELVKLVPGIKDSATTCATLLRALHEREQLCSTGIGDGIALPHSRNALVGLVERPVIVFGRHDRGIPFGAIDGKPARLFFLLVAPTVTEHLAVLARLSRILHSPKLRTGLLSTDRPEGALALIREAESKLHAG
jgi:mannitol/fructose-specific phosphotransferase system IIA component (Ntr-type)